MTALHNRLVFVLPGPVQTSTHLRVRFLNATALSLGGPIGWAKNLKLDKHADKIDGYLDKGINKVAIAKLLDVSPKTLYERLEVR